MKRFSGLKARDYEFKNEDGSTNRHVIALFMGTKKVGFMEYDTARHFVDRIHDLCDEHEAKLRAEEKQ